MSRLKVLLTGAGGRIGPHILPTFRERYDLSVADRRPVPGVDSTIITDLQDKEVLRSAMEGVDVVMHLAATSDEAPFIENLLPNNVVGAYNIYQAAMEAKVRRVVFASTGQTVRSRHMDKPVRATDPPRPATIYGVTKVFGEVLGRYYHDEYGLEVIAIRIGAFEDYESEKMKRHPGMQYVWLSPRDAVQLFTKSIEAPGVGYAVIFGTSNTHEEILSLQEARDVLGYEPLDHPKDYFDPLPPK
jgi:nucleoside-diphosphate-sugar epimerase